MAGTGKGAEPSTIAFGATIWVWKEHLAITGKYAFDFGVRQRFDNNT